MLNLTKPKYFMPIHGEYAMLAKHCELAQETGIPARNCFILGNGDVLTLTEDGVTHKTKVPCGNVYVDDNGFIADSDTIKERRSLSKNGILCLTIPLIDNKLVALPSIVSRGFIYNKTSHDLISEVLDQTCFITNSFLENNECFTNEEINKYIEDELSEFIVELTGRKPILKIIILKNSSN